MQMPFLEPISFCSPEEYERYKPDRIGPADIEKDELYTFMSRLEEKGDRQAVRSTIEVLGISVVRGSIDILFYDKDMEPGLKAEARFDEGNYVDFQGSVMILDTVTDTKIGVSRSYLRDHFSEIDDYLLSAKKENELVGSR